MTENQIHRLTALTPISFHRFFFFIYNLFTLLPNYTIQAPPGTHSRDKQHKSQKASLRVNGSNNKKYNNNKHKKTKDKVK